MENAIKVNLVPAKVVQAKAQKPRIETLPYQKTKGNYGVQTKKVKKIPKFKELKLLPAASFEVKPDKKEKNVESTLDEKLERINILPYGKKELRDTLNDYSKVKSLSSEMTSWLNGNNSKFLEILNVFRKIGKKNCLTYAQFISTMVCMGLPKMYCLFICLFVFYGISTFVDYYMPNPFLYDYTSYFKQFSLALSTLIVKNISISSYSV